MRKVLEWKTPAEALDEQLLSLQQAGVATIDEAGQFRSRKMQRALTRHGLVGSMGQVASAADNAAMESFFPLLQKNVLDRHSWDTREQLRIAILTWVERTYDRRRRRTAPGRLTPRVRDHHSPAADQAA